MTGDELSCSFATVSRIGDVITWRGRCSTGDTAPKVATVTANLRGGALAITIDGVPNGSLRRCRPR